MLFTLSGLPAGCGTSAQNTAPETSAPTSTTTTSAAEPAKNEKRVVKHEMGETEIVGTPQRIVVMDFSFADAVQPSIYRNRLGAGYRFRL